MTAADRDIAKQDLQGNTYLTHTLSPLFRNRAMEKALELLRGKVTPPFDAIAVRGASGMFGAMLAFALDVPLMVVGYRPFSHRPHNRIEGPKFVQQRVLIVDDFVRSGNTLSDIAAIVKEEGHRVVGVYLYRDHIRNPDIKRSQKKLPRVSWWAFGYDNYEEIDEEQKAVAEAPEVSNL